MADQLRKLKRRQLLELLVAQGKELETKKKQLEAAQQQITGLENRLAKMGEGVRRTRRGLDEPESEGDILAQVREEASDPPPKQGGPNEQ